MPLRMGYLYDALRTATGIDDEAARKAAEEVAGYDNRIAKVESDLTVLKWMVGTVIALVLINLGLTMRILEQMR